VLSVERPAIKRAVEKSKDDPRDVHYPDVVGCDRSMA